MTRITEKEWVEDFQEFVKSEGPPVPEGIAKEVLGQVRRDLNPSGWIVFAKLLGIHSVIGTLSLAICNQFGVSPFHSGFSLSEYFMTFGHSACMFFCGTLFLSLSMLLFRALIRPEEFRVLRRNASLQVMALGAISLGIFAMVGAEFTVAIGALWFAGAMLGGVGTVYLPRRSSFRGV
jgi:hypothetical protein